MVNIRLLVLFLLSGFQIMAQDAISGYINLGDPPQWEPEVYLSRIELRELPEVGKTRLVAVSPVDKQGYFSFKRAKFSDQEALYRLQLRAAVESLHTAPPEDRLLILSRKDKVLFELGGKGFGRYKTTNQADQEWQRLRAFEKNLRTQLNEEEENYLAYRSYAKDSLQILMVKLISLRHLDERQLLEKDIRENPDYYMALLEELRASELKREDYWFLEQKLVYLATDGSSETYGMSHWLNLILASVIVILLGVFAAMRRREKKAPCLPLSRQERNVQALIMAGKTNKEIAGELFISVNTVKTHITNIYQKLNITNRQELLRQK